MRVRTVRNALFVPFASVLVLSNTDRLKAEPDCHSTGAQEYTCHLDGPSDCAPSESGCEDTCEGQDQQMEGFACSNVNGDGQSEWYSVCWCGNSGNS